MKTPHIRKIISTTLGLSSSILLSLNIPAMAAATPYPLGTLTGNKSIAQNSTPLSNLSTINSSASNLQVKPRTSNLQWVSSIAEKVIRANGLDEHPWRIQISDEYDINAHASELNKIVIYKGLLDQIHGDDAALAFIISHELAHHTQRHLAQQEETETRLKNQLQKEAETEFTDWLVAEKTKSVKPIPVITKEVIQQRIAIQKKQQLDKSLQALSRQHELEADEIGYTYMAKSGYDMDGGFRVFSLLSRLPSDYTENSTHPPTQLRINALKQVVIKHPWLNLWIDGNQRLTNNSQPLKFTLSEDGISLRINSRFVQR
ncbi:M48 family metallopeptidase [Calothrix sp. PCC 6303]|uniref:M48 family metallopeptidase n=1 Tax=Calothrix sp. PCC 6303 TaxID=1170562 RepID=UPI0002A04059|nr:M48 family metallopeptidase [Calothrix sp. PCC 6303]AFZ01714.1 peptidase M48 Ste24p [Calothrix sp. PCC 6303]